MTTSAEEYRNSLIESLLATDIESFNRVLNIEDEKIIHEVVDLLPVNHLRQLIIQLRNSLAVKIMPYHLVWLQNILSHKYSAISSMTDGRSILMPLRDLLEDRTKCQDKLTCLRGKLILLNQLRKDRMSLKPKKRKRSRKSSQNIEDDDDDDDDDLLNDDDDDEDIGAEDDPASGENEEDHDDDDDSNEGEEDENELPEEEAEEEENQDYADDDDNEDDKDSETDEEDSDTN